MLLLLLDCSSACQQGCLPLWVMPHGQLHLLQLLLLRPPL
jgi:hypothetical protein